MSYISAFIQRYPQMFEDAITIANQKVREAKVRVNATKARMIKAKIQPAYEENVDSKEQLIYRKNCVEHAEAINYLQNIQIWGPRYLSFFLEPNNEYVRYDLDTDVLTWTTLEDFIYTMNEAYLYSLLEDLEIPCNCGATDENYQDCLYFDTRPRRHVYTDYKGICSHGTKMTLVNKESVVNRIGFRDIQPLDILTLEVF